MPDWRLALAIVLIVVVLFLANDERGRCLGIDVSALLGENGAAFAEVFRIEVLHLNY